MQVSPSSEVRDLGVVFDQYLTFHYHISGICKSTNFHLRGIGRIQNLLTFDATAQLIHALITSRLDFCNRIIYLMCIIFMFLQCVSTVIIVYIIISPLNSYLYIHWILDFK